MAQIRGVFRKTIIDTSSRVDFWPVKRVFTPIFRLHTVATARGLLTYGYSLLTYPALIEIYPLVSFLPSEDVGFSGYMLTLLLWTPLTGAQASNGRLSGTQKLGWLRRIQFAHAQQMPRGMCCRFRHFGTLIDTLYS